MKKILKVTKKFIGMQIEKSVLKQKNEWPATSTPVFFQPERPQKDTDANHTKDK